MQACTVRPSGRSLLEDEEATANKHTVYKSYMQPSWIMVRKTGGRIMSTSERKNETGRS